MNYKMAITINNYFKYNYFSVNGLNASIKRHKVAEWIKQDLCICYV